ncbi:MAG: TetR/AcrR family transcriptional regulator [Rhodobiaceae bacterium]|nr:TetR/AcrR family transcriptional regulator [Rhodobiaceae bacterium]
MARAKIEDERKEQILQAFETCVIRHGLAKTTLQKVADEAGLPRSLVRYFVGNRDSMVDLLIARMIDRGEATLATAQRAGVANTLGDLIDTIFAATFGDETSNNVVGELWYLAIRDVTMRTRLADMYGRITDALVAQMTAEEIGPGMAEREDVAQALLSLAYGEASFTDIGLKKPNLISSRRLADALISELATASKT